MKARNIFALSVLTASIALASGCSSDDDGGDPEPPVTDPGDTTDPGDMINPGPMSPPATMSGNSIIDLARGTEDDDGNTVTEGVADLENLVTTLAAYPDLIDLLDDETMMFTVFAPNNEAFDDLDLDDVDEADREAFIRNTLVYHVVPDTVYNSSTDQTLPQTLTTAQGAEIMIVDDGTGMASIVDGDDNVAIGTAVDTASNGVVYVIDTVLTAPEAASEPVDPGPTDPAGPGADAVEGSTLAALQDDDDLSSVAAIVGERDQSLQAADDGNRSQLLFAPRNSAFDAGATSILAYTVTARGPEDAGMPATSGTTYTGFSDLTGDPQGADKLQFAVSGEGDTLMVNNLPAELVETTSGPVLYVYGGGDTLDDETTDDETTDDETTDDETTDDETTDDETTDDE